MYLNRLGLAVAWGRQTGKTNQALVQKRWEQYSFMKVNEPIVPIYPKLEMFTFRVERVPEGELRLVTTLDFGHGGFNILAPKLPRINVGTVGHCDWPTVNLV
jgi:hypothetical protein